MKRIKELAAEFKLLQRSIPGVVFAIFMIAVVAMNLLANKSIDTGLEWLALDCGFIFSWVIFLVMDMITKRFGGRAATMVSLMALAVNLFIAFMFLVAGMIPGVWGESFVDVGGDLINVALDNTFSGTWYVLLGSSIAFVVSAVVNNTLNDFLGKVTKNSSSFKVFAFRSYVSTFTGQFIDNLLFACIVSLNFFGWTAIQCITCAITGALAELLCEVVFSPVGYAVSRRWEKEKVGSEYLEYMKSKRSMA